MRTPLKIVLACVSTVALVAAAGAAPASARPRPTNGFAPTGPWNTKLPRHVPLAPNSAAIVANLKADKDNTYGVWPLMTDTYSAPIYTVGPAAPTQTWSARWDDPNCFHGSGPAPADYLDSLTAVPTLPDMITSQGTDNEIAIYQPSTDTYWDFWRAEKDANGQWGACWGGKIAHYSRNPGIFDDSLGATATGLPLGAFVIRIDELRRGHIDHAVNIATVRTRSDCVSWPAQRTDGLYQGDDLACEGQRFRLDPSFDVDTLTNPAARTIARAMQEYGAIVTDKSDALIMQAEDPRPYMARNGGVNPYDALFAGAPYYAVLDGIPVDRLQALPVNYGLS